jgi:CubicO group peptidase (beta-lactamase class C family)
MLTGFPLRFLVNVYQPQSNIRRALDGSDLPHDTYRIYARDFEVPSGGGIASARGIAGAYNAFAMGDTLGVSRETLALLAAPAVPSANGFYDECLKSEARFSLGFMKPSHGIAFGSPSSFGSPGAGGAMGFADPELGIGYAYVTSQMGTTLTGDPRDVALRDALYAACRA